MWSIVREEPLHQWKHDIKKSHNTNRLVSVVKWRLCDVWVSMMEEILMYKGKMNSSWSIDLWFAKIPRESSTKHDHDTPRSNQRRFHILEIKNLLDSLKKKHTVKTFFYYTLLRKCSMSNIETPPRYICYTTCSGKKWTTYELNIVDKIKIVLFWLICHVNSCLPLAPTLAPTLKPSSMCPLVISSGLCLGHIPLRTLSSVNGPFWHFGLWHLSSLMHLEISKSYAWLIQIQIHKRRQR